MRRCAPTPLRCSERGRAAPLATLTSFAPLEQARRARPRGALTRADPAPALQAAPGLAVRPFARHEPSPGRLVSVLTSSPPQMSPPPQAACRVATAEACGCPNASAGANVVAMLARHATPHWHMPLPLRTHCTCNAIAIGVANARTRCRCRCAAAAAAAANVERSMEACRSHLVAKLRRVRKGAPGQAAARLARRRGTQGPWPRASARFVLRLGAPVSSATNEVSAASCATGHGPECRREVGAQRRPPR